MSNQMPFIEEIKVFHNYSGILVVLFSIISKFSPIITKKDISIKELYVKNMRNFLERDSKTGVFLLNFKPRPVLKLFEQSGYPNTCVTKNIYSLYALSLN